jgi:hypothetical protein
MSAANRLEPDSSSMRALPAMDKFARSQLTSSFSTASTSPCCTMLHGASMRASRSSSRPSTSAASEKSVTLVLP